ADDDDREHASRPAASGNEIAQLVLALSDKVFEVGRSCAAASTAGGTLAPRAATAAPLPSSPLITPRHVFDSSRILRCAHRIAASVVIGSTGVRCHAGYRRPRFAVQSMPAARRNSFM